MHDDARGQIDRLTAAANELSAQPRDDARRSRHKAVVLPDHKIVYVTNLKVACSTIKWMLFDLEGRDETALHASLKPRPTRSQTIHDHELWGDTPKLALREGHGDPAQGWFVFTVLRDPRPRVWSAWQSKLLCGNPNYLHRGEPEQPWWPRSPETADDVIDDFHRFVETLDKQRRRMHRVGRDGHFRPQSDLLHKPGLTYSHVYDLTHLPLLLADLQQHLDALGKGPLPPLRRENETPLAATADIFTPRALELIADVYAEDFDRFGAVWPEVPRTSTEPWHPAALADVRFRRVAHQRIADLSQEAQRMRDELDATDDRPRRRFGRAR